MADYIDNTQLDRELGWDDVIENDSEFILLPEGDYPFMVIDFERGRHGGSTKLPPCNKAILTINIASDQGDITIKHNLFLHSKCEGMLCKFFTAIGQREKGEKLRMDWSKVKGSTGICRVIIDEYEGKDGNKYKNNKIKSFLEPNQSQSESLTPIKPFGVDKDVPF